MKWSVFFLGVSEAFLLQMMRVTSRKLMLTSFFTDLEGSLSYFNNFLAISKVLYETGGRLELRDNTRFVFGGDAFDKGDGDLEICTKLVDLKRRYAERVTFILGNRDVNKTNFSSHFSDRILAQRPEEVPVPFFAGNVPSYAAFLAMEKLPHDIVSLFKYRLKFTMGCPTTFELRRSELAKRTVSSCTVTDMDVVNSFIDSVRPGGIVREYLQLGQLMEIIDGTVFVHGAVLPQNVGFVPDDTLVDCANPKQWDQGRFFVKEQRPAQEWCDALNSFARRSISKWLVQPEMDERGVRGSHAICGYGHRKAIGERTVMVMTYMETGSPQFVDLDVVQYLNMSGVHRVCCGHQPAGDTPCVVNQPGLSIVQADSSYCSNKTASGRGEAVCEVLLDGDTGVATAHGRRHDGTPYSFDTEDDVIGRPVGDNWWTKAIIGDNKDVLLQRTVDRFFTKEERVLPRAEAEELVGAFTRSNHGMGKGAPHATFTREDLRPPQQIKTKVPPTSSPQSQQ